MTLDTPLRDMRFVLETVVGRDRLRALPGHEDLADADIDAVLEAAYRLCRRVLAPLDRPGDEQGCRYENGAVATPAGFRDAYEIFRDGGWTGVAADPAYGGQGLPRCVEVSVTETICAANLSFGIMPGLSQGAVRAIAAHGDAELRDRTLPRLVSGHWSGTMCLTEPHCGTDLGMVRTMATPAADGAWRVAGTKIFVSAGEHDLTENILHLVLARTPGAPAGTRGLGLFLVPKLLPGGQPNAVHCGGLERKMGIHASPTCVLNFDGATGWLIGEPHGGMRCMFTMMNEARLAVGIQGLGIAEAAYRDAVAYARQRLQGRAPNGAQRPDLPADPIIVHPDVRRMLLTMRAWVEGMRAMGVWVAWHLDLRERHPDPARRQQADDLVQVTTPVVKALFTDLGFAAADLGVQVLGGHGYIRDNGMEQRVRDARITRIYEGTNGIQALDLVGRKLPAHFGRGLRSFFHPLLGFIAEARDQPGMEAFAGPLAKATGRLQQATAHLARQGASRPEAAAAAASDYLRLFGLVALGWRWAEMARAALAEDDAFHRAKRDTARFFMEQLLPETATLSARIVAGGETITAFDEACF